MLDLIYEDESKPLDPDAAVSGRAPLPLPRTWGRSNKPRRKVRVTGLTTKNTKHTKRSQDKAPDAVFSAT